MPSQPYRSLAIPGCIDQSVRRALQDVDERLETATVAISAPGPHTATSIPNGDPPTVSVETSDPANGESYLTFTFEIPEGDVGATGDTGPAGPAPTVTGSASATDIANGSPATAAVTVTEPTPDNYEFAFAFEIPAGADGADGATGDTGPAPGIDAATDPAVPLSYGADPTAAVVVTEPTPDNYLFTFEFGIPEGAPGSDGVTPTIDAAASATDIANGSPATAVVTVTEPTPDNYLFTFDFEIPAGDTGPAGPDSYIPLTTGDWAGDPSSMSEAIDRLAAAVVSLLGTPVP